MIETRTFTGDESVQTVVASSECRGCSSVINLGRCSGDRGSQRCRSDAQVRARVGDAVVGVGQCALGDSVGSNIQTTGSDKCSTQFVRTDQTGRGVAQQRINTAVNFALGIRENGQRGRVHTQCAIRVADGVVSTAQPSRSDDITACIDRALAGAAVAEHTAQSNYRIAVG